MRAPEVWGNGYSVVNSLLHQPWAWTAVLLVLVAQDRGDRADHRLRRGRRRVHADAVRRRRDRLAVRRRARTRCGRTATSAPFAYAMIGMGAFLAAATSAPLMAILMIFEMTLSYQVVLPLMLASVVAYLIARSVEERSMYEITSKRNREEKERMRLRGMHMRDLVKPADTVLPLTATVPN